MNLPLELLNDLEPCAVCETIAYLRAAIGQTPSGQTYSLLCTACGYSAPPQHDLELAGHWWNATQGVREFQRGRLAAQQGDLE
jgi:hypothetical protein